MVTLVKLFGKEQLMQWKKVVFKSMHLLTPYSKRIFLDTDIVYKPITFRIDEYFLVRKHCLTGSVKKNE